MLKLNRRFCAILLLLPVITCAQATKQTQQPNIVFILVDDLGWADIEPFGTTFYETPNLKKMAARGMLFSQAYSASPVCSPSRASIMTGKYPTSTRTTDWFGAPQPEDLRKEPASTYPLLPAPYQPYLALEETTIAEALQQAGYKTFLAGKWHLGEEEQYWPEHQGFEINKGGYSKGHPNSYFAPYNNPRLNDGAPGEYLPMRIADEANAFIEAHKDHPFFAYLPLYDVHTPLQASQVLVEKYQRKKDSLGLQDQFAQEGKYNVRVSQTHVVYAAMVEAMDQAIGKVLDKLVALGLEEQTLVVFFSDNGGLSITGGAPTSNLPLRAGKGWLYEGGIRVPMILSWPGTIAAGSRCDVPVIGTDFYPTFLQVAGLQLNASQHSGGSIIWPLMQQRSIARRSLYWHYPHYGNQGGSPASAIRKGDWKLIHWYVDDRYELFHLTNDIGEQNNLLQQYPKKAAAMKKELAGWLKKERAQMPEKR